MRHKTRGIILFLFLVFFFSLRVVFDADLGLHLRVGAEIFKNKALVYGNPFGLYFQNYPYVYHSWLTQLTLFVIYQSFGLYGLSFFYALLTTLSIFVLYQICLEKGKEPVSLLPLVFLTPLAVFISGLRVRAISFLFLAILYLFLLRIEKGEKRLALFIPPLFVFWANLHGGFLMGLIFLFLWGGSEWFLFKSAESLFFLIKIFALSLLLTLVNPYGTGVYTQSLKMVTTPLMFKLNLDWQPLTVNMTALLVGILFTLFVFFFRKKISLRSNFLFFSLLFLSGLVARFFLIFVLVSIPIIVQIFGFLKTRQWFKSSIRVLPVFLSLAVFTMSVFLKQTGQIAKMVWAYQSMENYASSLGPPIPIKAIKFIKETKLSQGMLNDFNWGSFLLWQLPERKIFVDGRMDTFNIEDQPFLDDYWQMVAAKKDWEELLEKYQIKTVFLAKTYPLVNILLQLPEWKKAYEDDLSVIVIKG